MRVTVLKSVSAENSILKAPFHNGLMGKLQFNQGKFKKFLGLTDSPLSD